MTARASHWDDVYAGRPETDLSWYEPSPEVSLDLVRTSGAAAAAPVVDVGGGASSLVDVLLRDGFTDVTVVDLSAVALQRTRTRLGPDTPATLLVADVLTWQPPRRYAIWHDRAVFHFLTDAADRDRYRQALLAGLAPGGAVVLGTFAEDGPVRCSGLPTARYDAAGLAAELPAGFEVLRTRRHAHVTPAGVVQPFTWLLARRPGA